MVDPANNRIIGIIEFHLDGILPVLSIKDPVMPIPVGYLDHIKKLWLKLICDFLYP